MGVRPCGDAHFTESVYDQKTAQASVRLKTKVWNPKKRQSKTKRKPCHDIDDKAAPAHGDPIAKFLVPAETLNYPRTPMVTGEASVQSAVSRKGMETAKAWFRLNRLRADVLGFFNAFIFNAFKRMKKDSYGNAG